MTFSASVLKKPNQAQSTQITINTFILLVSERYWNETWPKLVFYFYQAVTLTNCESQSYHNDKNCFVKAEPESDWEQRLKNGS